MILSREDQFLCLSRVFGRKEMKPYGSATVAPLACRVPPVLDSDMSDCAFPDERRHISTPIHRNLGCYVDQIKSKSPTNIKLRAGCILGSIVQCDALGQAANGVFRHRVCDREWTGYICRDRPVVDDPGDTFRPRSSRRENSKFTHLPPRGC